MNELRLVVFLLYLVFSGGLMFVKVHSRKKLMYHRHLECQRCDGDREFRPRTSIPKPEILTPSAQINPSIEKFMMIYTCKKCNGRNAQMVSKVAYQSGMVVSTCKHCKAKHLIADNEGKLDMGEYGKRIDDYLEQQGEQVQKMTVSPGDLEDNYLVDQDGILTLVSKDKGQLDPSVRIVDMPTTPTDWNSSTSKKKS